MRCKAATKEYFMEKESIKMKFQIKKKGDLSFSMKDKVFSPQLWHKAEAEEAIEGDWSSNRVRKGVSILKALIEEEMDDESLMLGSGQRVAIGCRHCHHDLWKGIGDGVSRNRGGKVYDAFLSLKRARMCVSQVCSLKIISGKALPFLLAYKYTIRNVFSYHNHPKLLLDHSQSYICVFAYVLVLGHCVVGIQNLPHFLSSISVKNMDREQGKVAWDSEVHTSNHMSISSSTNHSGINTHGGQNVEVPNPDENTRKHAWEFVEDRSSTPQMESLDAQLYKIKLESLEFKKNNSPMGFVCGNTTDFKKVKAKILGTWRLMRGAVQIYERGHGWFECIFREPHYLKRIWNGRPYHVIGHLLLLRPWRGDFSTKLENTNVLDLWIRIFHLHSTLACHDGVKLILEENKLGKFIKFDRASGGSFARACVNIDIDKHVPVDVRISDNEDHPLLLVWFEDFPYGCGNCGDLEHNYKSCPLRKFNPKKINITIIRKDTTPNVVSTPTVKVVSEEDEEGWVLVNNGKKRKPFGASSSNIGPQRSLEVSDVAAQVLRSEVVKAVSNQKEKEGQGGEVFSSPKDYFKDDSKEEGEIDEEMEALLEKVEMIGEAKEIQDQEKFIEELERDMLGPSPSELILKMKMPPTTAIFGDNNNSNSDSLKRKGEKEASEDTTTSSLKRKKTREYPC